jgi:hypothetical protein
MDSERKPHVTFSSDTKTEDGSLLQKKPKDCAIAFPG